MINTLNYYLQYIIIYLKELDTYLLGLLIGNQTLFYILCTIFIMKIKEYSRQSVNKAAITYIIGTFLHELAHYIVGYILTFKKPTTISIFPEEIKNGNKKWYILGYVDIDENKLNTFNRFPIGFAPLLLIIICYFVSKDFLFIYSHYFQITFVSMVFYIFLVVTIFVNSIPSSADFKLSIKQGSLFFWLTLTIFLILIYFGVKHV